MFSERGLADQGNEGSKMVSRLEQGIAVGARGRIRNIAIKSFQPLESGTPSPCQFLCSSLSIAVVIVHCPRADKA